MLIKSAVVCGAGLRRPENQDNFYLNGYFRPEPGDMSTVRLQNNAEAPALFAVADGMGGETHGELASLAAVRGMGGLCLDEPERALREHLAACNGEICRMADEHGGKRIGTTFAGLCVDEAGVAVMTNIGDSRAYLFRGGKLLQLSCDHTLVQRMTEAGLITPEEARVHPERHKITQHLGIFPEEMAIDPFFAELCVQQGDVFVLCSDGLTDMVSDELMTHVLELTEDVEIAADAMSCAALNAGGRDNITVMLIKIA